jgi:hypothetical protein
MVSGDSRNLVLILLVPVSGLVDAISLLSSQGARSEVSMTCLNTPVEVSSKDRDRVLAKEEGLCGIMGASRQKA